MAKTSTCKHCGGTVAKNADKCPHCGGLTWIGQMDVTGDAVISLMKLVIGGGILIGIIMWLQGAVGGS